MSSLAERCICCCSVGRLALLDVTFRNFLVWRLYVLPFQALPHLCLCAWNHSTNILAHSCSGTFWHCDSGCPGVDSSCPLINNSLAPTPQLHQKKFSRKMWTSTGIVQTFAPQIGILIFLILGNEILLSQTSQSCLSFENAIIIKFCLSSWVSCRMSEHFWTSTVCGWELYTELLWPEGGVLQLPTSARTSILHMIRHSSVYLLSFA